MGPLRVGGVEAVFLMILCVRARVCCFFFILCVGEAVVAVMVVGVVPGTRPPDSDFVYYRQIGSFSAKWNAFSFLRAAASFTKEWAMSN